MARQFKIVHEGVTWKPEGLFSFFRAITPADNPRDLIQVAVNLAMDFYERYKQAVPNAKGYTIKKWGFQGSQFIVIVEVQE